MLAININNSKKMSCNILCNLIVLLLIFTSVHSCGPGRGVGGPRKHRKLTPLVFKQHVPNMPEKALGASGLFEGRISRDDEKFRKLIPNYNRDIIFKDDEGTGADRVMTQRCKDKLSTLTISVMNQWPGIRLRVIESWDEDGRHDAESLHYEGRAVDITTSDRDSSKYGMLARLAVEAGFDWVYYESRGHIHCSVKSDSAEGSHTTGCFAADSTVLTSTGVRRRLSELEVGEKVLSIDAKGKAVFSEVLMFLDRDTDQQRQFVRIRTDGGAELTVTPAHLIMVWKPNMKVQFTFANRVEEGDYVLVNINNTLVPKKVEQISVAISKGAFAPLTQEGTIIVDSIAASCYAFVDSQSIAHWSFLPMRIMDSIWHWFSKNPFVSRQMGIHWYANALYSIKDLILPADWMFH